MAILPFPPGRKIPRIYLVMFVAVPIILCLAVFLQISKKPIEEIRPRYRRPENILSLTDKGKIQEALKIFTGKPFQDLNTPPRILFPGQKEIEEFLLRPREKPNPFSR